MNVEPTGPFRNAIVCEYASRDEHNKHMLAGIFSGDILVSQHPAELRLAVYAEYLPPAGGAQTVDVVFHLADRRLGKATVKITKATAGQPAVILIPRFDLTVAGDSELRIDAVTNGAEATTIVRKQIRRGPATG